ncbi:hypothetical protein QLL95_gp0266 [Cotonvirus japonicus]|uniref:Uncharacterized protein n=1 Tax=Cotonvirus japonicus TaxID=2811091 RepID=A0ABM7NRG5_9VIRU|nr:hypothetical protein QLL95_gp0266 [Cotonvirus japonicus]BCS82755.1 hypothetical protein [Cotonvirus japonicus]
MNLITKGIRDITKQILTKKPHLSQEETLQRFFKLNPNIKHDKIFMRNFPIVYSITTMEMNLKDSENQRLKESEIL